MNSQSLSLLLLAAALAACSEAPLPPPAPLAPGTGAAVTPPAAITAADEFLQRLASHCGEAFEGRVIANTPAQHNDAFGDQRLVMHVRECSADQLRVPFHVGDDHSRTWILTRTDTGLRLKHDHRHEDGSDDDVTMYGGETAASGSAMRQEFPVDDYSVEMFLREGLPASISNVWAMEIEPGERFLYELTRRAEQRLFQVEFDLTTPVAPPPTPWGHTALPGDG